MRVIQLSAILFFVWVGAWAKGPPADIAAKSLPDHIGNFRASDPVRPAEIDFTAVNSAGERNYRAVTGETLSVLLVVTPSDSSAYALFAAGSVGGDGSHPVETREIGVRTSIQPASITFIRGSVFVAIRGQGERLNRSVALALARQVAALLDQGEGDIPVLVKHLPDWEKAQAQARYPLDSESLRRLNPDQPIIEAVSFEGGTEAVVAPYGPARLMIVEFTTPQLAGDNDRRIVSKIQELVQQGQPVPSAYRRVGNYSVFVFNAPNEQSANQLIDQVKYQQVVQWLGENPNLLENLQRQYTETMLGTFVSVIKASGIAAVFCFGVGGFFGAVLFARRRAQQLAAQTYSDAGGMMRLNIDDLPVERNTARLLGPIRSDEE